MAGALSYMGRMMRDRVRSHGRPVLTRDIHEAALFHQAWKHPRSGVRVEFDVVAFPADAERQGRIRLASKDDYNYHAPEMQLVECRELHPDLSHMKLDVVAYECPEEGEIRRQRWVDGAISRSLDEESDRELAHLRRDGYLR